MTREERNSLITEMMLDTLTIVRAFQDQQHLMQFSAQPEAQNTMLASMITSVMSAQVELYITEPPVERKN